ncbi:Transposase [Sphingobacterium nematocida]|uniref:Transposase n=1 Tax=Sphingobacterium nematocida TaxID=1513896 RepID=A0A1T5DNW5_9SPHI|nr:IS110 family transposase [Sphingobacterium nematocida]SKB68744.1 Transposase [Sphingobacterium nematocida]SKB73281.1 Transposase [Sphingobacterium nematocida]SKB87519.1 Transposase [Sphingobacterium nematocida]SKC04865.1 Transposase [Sphingobacterium nematocida]
MVTGIDCSKDYFDIAVLKEGKVAFKGRFANNSKGFTDMLRHTQGSHVAMEATGPYYFQLARFLYDSGTRVSVVNPLVIRRFAQMRLSRAKTDKKDAMVIAAFVQMTSPKLWEPPTEAIQSIRNLETYLEGLKQRRHMLGSQLHAFEAAGTIDRLLYDEITEEVESHDKRIGEKERQIEILIKQHYAEMASNIRSVPGIGPRSVSMLIIATDGFGMFKNYKQVISYFGLAPRIYESGTSVKGKGHICKMGMGQVRKVLYMAAVSAIKCNKACKDLYERLRGKGKPYRVAIIAAVNKLIKQVFAIAKSGEPYKVQLS